MPRRSNRVVEDRVKDEPATGTSFIIQVDRPGQKLDMAAIRALLEGTNVQLDPSYGPIPINPKLGRYVVRGVATPEARAKAERIPGVRFFSDVKQKPMSR
jgi:hypothetical protein